MATTRRDSVQSLDRAFDLLEALAEGGELGVTELAERTGLVPSTAHRLLATLVKRDYVTQNAISGRYLLGYKVVEVASGLEHRLSRLRAAARPHLESVQQATGETANLVILDGDHVVYADQEPLERLTPRTLVTLEELREDFRRIRRRGYAIDHEEHEEGVGCVAAPLFDHTGRPCAAISVSGPSARIVDADTAELGALLVEHGGRISEALGYRPEATATAAG